MPDCGNEWMDKIKVYVEPGKRDEWNTKEDRIEPVPCNKPVLPEIASDTIKRINCRVAHARHKHPDWLKRDDYVLSVAEMEWHEFAHALSWEGRKRAEEEALDLIAVLVRFIEGDAD